MKSELIQTLTSAFVAHVQQADGGTEFLLARDLQCLLGYAEWCNFNGTGISKARTACELSCYAVSDHFVDVNKMVGEAYSTENRTVGANFTSLGPAGRRLTGSESRRLTRRQHLDSTAIDPKPLTGYRNRHIRPMAVRPLDHPERWPTPWGFLFSGSEKAREAPSQGRSP